jgi:hypothetical protein
MIVTGSTVNVARDDKGNDENAIPVTLLSPLSPLKKGANALYIGILSPCHPFLKKFLYMTKANWSKSARRGIKSV